MYRLGQSRSHYYRVEDLPFKHEYYMWMPTNVGMDCHWKAKIVILPVEEVKVISPEIFNVFRINPAVGVWCFLDEHHRRKIVKIPR